MKKTLIAGLVVASLASVGAHASDDLSYRYVDVNYTSYDLDGFTVDGFEVQGSARIGENWFVSPSLITLTESGVTLSLWSVDIGRSFSLSSATDIVVAGRLAFDEISASGYASETDNGYGAVVGIRSMVGQRTELAAFASWEDWGDTGTETFFEARLRQNFSSNFYARLSYKFESSDASAFVVGVGYRF